MNRLNLIPLVRLVIPLIIGIASGIWFNVSIAAIPFVILAFLLLTIIVIVHISKKGKALFGTSTAVLLVFIGIKLVEINTIANKPYYLKKIVAEDKYELVATIAEPPQIKAKSVKTTLALSSIKVEEKWLSCDGKIMAYFALDSSANKLTYGSTVHFKSELKEIEAPKNPGQFDYKYYLQNKGIYHQCYLNSNSYEILKETNGNVVYDWANKARKTLISQLKQSGLSGRQLAVASALLLGYDDDIDNELLQGFSASGTMHILSVSGMHAGLVYLLFTWLLQFLGESLWARIFRVTIIITALWAYALLTGFSAPVIRAAVMFSFLSIGLSLNRYTNPINILAGSCLLMLVINPLLLADVGFQLSYLAVLGISLLYSPIYNLWESKNWLLDNIWQITAMSLVAQLATFPLGLFYFHQFPNYFIISNLLIIPLSTIIIFGGIVLLALSFIQPIASILGYILNKLIVLLNWLVIQNKNLPYATTPNVNFSQLETFIIYIVIAVLGVACYYKKKKWLFAGLALLIVFFANRIYLTNQVLHQQKLVVYNTSKSTAVEVISGNTSILYTDSLSMPGTRNYAFNLAGSSWYYSIDERNAILLKNSLIEYGNLKIAILTKNTDLPSITNVNYLVIANTPLLDFEAIKKLNPNMVIFSNNNKRSKVEYWQHECIKRGIPHYNLAAENAFIADI